MSATKRHLEDLAEKHAFYATHDDLERAAYLNAILDCAGRLLKSMEAPETDLDAVMVLSGAVKELHALYDELVAVDNWQPARKRYDRIASVI